MSDQNDANPAVTDDIADPDTFTSFLDVRSDEDVQVSQSPNAASTTVIDTTSNAVESAGHAFTQPISSDASTIQPTRQPLVDEHHAEVANITTPIVTTNSAPSPQPIDHPLEQVLTPAEVVIPPTVLDPLSSPSASVPPQQFNLNEAESTGAPPHDITTTTTTANNNAAVNFNGNESNSSGDGSVVAFAQPKSPPVLLPPPSDVFSPSPPHSTTTTTTTMTTDMVVSDDSIGQQSDIISSETAKEELPSTLPSQPVVVQDDPIEHTQSNEPQYGSIEPLNKAPVIQPALPLSPKYNSHDSNTYDNNSHGSGASGFSDAPQYLQQQQPPPHLLLPSQLSAINPSPRSTILPPVDGRPLVTGDSGRGGFLSRSQLPPSSPSSPQSLGTSHALPPTLTAPGSPVSGGGTSRFSPMSPLSHSTRAPPPPPSSSSATTPTNPASTIPPYVARSPGSPLSTASPLLPASQHLSPVKPVPPQLILGSPSSFPPGLLSPPPMIAQQSSSSSHRSNSQGVDSPRGSLPPLLLGAKDELSFPDKPPSDFQLSPGDLTLGRTMPPLQTNFPTHYGTPPGFPPSASMPSRKLKSKESKKDRRVMRKKSQSSSSSSSSASSSSASSSSSNMSQILGSTVGSSSPASPAFGPLPSSSSVLPSTPPASLPNLTDSVSGSYPPGPSPYSSSSPAGQQQVVVGSYPPYLHPQSAGSPSLSSSLAPSSPPSPSEYSSPASLPVPIQAPAYSREPSSPHSPPHGYPQQLSNTPYYSGHRTINFALLDDSALRRYKRHFKVRTKHNIPRTELLGTIQRHSASLSVEPRQIIDTFVTNTKAENKRRTRI